MRKFAVLSLAILLLAWGSITTTTAVDMNRVEGDRIWNCMQRYEKMAKATRDRIQPGQSVEIYRVFPGDLHRACELALPTGG